MSNESPKEPAAWWLPLAAMAGIAALAVAYIAFRFHYPNATLLEHATFGNAVAPIAVFLSLFALVAALWSVQVQRAELTLQRQELRETREEMVEQRKQFERTAGAQEALAESQAALATAQINANGEAAALRLAQHSSTIATLDAALATLDSAVTLANAVRPLPPDGHRSAVAERRQAIGDRIHLELGWEAALRELIAKPTKDA